MFTVKKTFLNPDDIKRKLNNFMFVDDAGGKI